MRRIWFTALATLTGCSLVTSLDGLSGGGGAPVAPVDAGEAGIGPGSGPDAGTEDASTASEAGPSYAQLVRADAPIAWWRFEESSGTVAHDEIGGHDATYAGAALLGVPGIVGGRGVSLGGASRPHATSSSPAFRFPGRASYTIEVWVLARGMRDFGRIASTEAASSNDTEGWYLAADANGNNLEHEFGTKGSYFRGLVWNGTLSPTKFQHVVVTYDGATTLIWIDGVRVASRTSPEQAPDVGLLTWGCRLNGSNAVNCLDATLDEAAIYDHALAEDRIVAHHTAGAP